LAEVDIQNSLDHRCVVDGRPIDLDSLGSKAGYSNLLEVNSIWDQRLPEALGRACSILHDVLLTVALATC